MGLKLSPSFFDLIYHDKETSDKFKPIKRFGSLNVFFQLYLAIHKLCLRLLGEFKYVE